jgi:hypothetical protein
MMRLGLTINEAKTSLKDARKERFDFLGYSFGPHRYKKNGHWYLSATLVGDGWGLFLCEGYPPFSHGATPIKYARR